MAEEVLLWPLHIYTIYLQLLTSPSNPDIPIASKRNTENKSNHITTFYIISYL